MREIDAHLTRLRDKLTAPCNRALLAYLLTFPERRVHRFTVAPFCTPKTLAALAKARATKQPFKRNVAPSTRRKVFRSLTRKLFRGEWKQTMTFITFIGHNRSHRQYLALTGNRPVANWYQVSDELAEFYRYFGCLTERWPSGDDGFIAPKFVVDLGSYGDLGRTMMAAPPQSLRPYPVIFRGRNGDCAFMDDEGRYRWFGWQRGRVKLAGDSFSEFLLEYIRHRSRHDALPFEAAGRRRGKYLQDDLAGSRIDADRVDREMALSSPSLEL